MCFLFFFYFILMVPQLSREKTNYIINQLFTIEILSGYDVAQLNTNTDLGYHLCQYDILW